jgi:hypothetical protein
LQHLDYLKEIVVVHGHKNTKLFNQVDDVLDTLGLENMSSDETDTEDSSPYSKKRVRRIELPWLHEKIIALKRSLEKLDHSRRYSKEKRGNHSCIRISSSTKIDTRPAPSGLPINWYNPTWLKGLSDLERQMLEPKPEREIPAINLEGADEERRRLGF